MRAGDFVRLRHGYDDTMPIFNYELPFKSNMSALTHVCGELDAETLSLVIAVGRRRLPEDPNDAPVLLLTSNGELGWCWSSFLVLL